MALQFLVDIFLDETYGTPVFVTVEGQSKCPHEENTRPIEQPLIDIVQRPGVVAQDDTMVFDLEIANEGYGESSFYLYSDKNENTDGLVLGIDDGNLNSMSTWILPGTKSVTGGSAIRQTLTVLKGPRALQFDPVDIYLQSKVRLR